MPRRSLTARISEIRPSRTVKMARLDHDRYPLVVEVARTGRGTDDAERFGYAVQALLTGFAAPGKQAEPESGQDPAD